MKACDIDSLTPMQRFAYEAVEEITDAKTGVVEPCMAHIHEIRDTLNKGLTEALRELYRKGILSVNFEINKHPMFQIKRKCIRAVDVADTPDDKP